MVFLEAILGPIKEVRDNLRGDSISIDNIAFKLFYQVTVSSLLIFSIILSIGQVCQALPHLWQLLQLDGMHKLPLTLFNAVSFNCSAEVI